MKNVLSIVALFLFASCAQAQDVWRLTVDGCEYVISRSYSIESAVAAAKKEHAAKVEAAKMESAKAASAVDVRKFDGIVLSVGPDNTTGMVTASTRGDPVPVLAVYHDGQNAIRWSPVEVVKLPPSQRVTPAESYIRNQPVSTTNTAKVVLCKT